MRLLTILAVLALIAAPAAAQSCSTLTVTGALAPGSTLSIDVTGATPDAYTLLFVGQHAGSHTFNFGMLGGFTIDLDLPFIPLPLGATDASGAASLSISVPAGAPSVPAAIAGTTLNLQAVTLDVTFTMGGPPTLNACVSNSASLTL